MNFPQIGRLLQWSSLCAINMIAKLNLPWLVFWNRIHACIHIVINSHAWHPAIHCFTGSAPVGVQCPLIYIFFLGEFPDFWDWLCGLWCPGLTPVLQGVHASPFPSPFHIWVFFHSHFFTCH